jgi:hypothetical protein
MSLETLSFGTEEILLIKLAYLVGPVAILQWARHLNTFWISQFLKLKRAQGKNKLNGAFIFSY